MSINSFNSLPSIQPSTAGDALGGAKAATSSSSAAPSGQEFSVYFERMMHPAFSQAASAQAQAQAQSTTLEASAAMSTSALKSADSNTSALSSSLLDPHSSTLAFSHEYLKTNASVADLKLHMPQASGSQHKGSVSYDVRSPDTPSATRQHGNDATRSNHHAQSASHSTLDRLQKRSDHASNADRQDTSNENAADAHASDSPSSSKPANKEASQADQNASAQTAGSESSTEQKLALAMQALDGQRLPSLSDPNAVDSLDANLNIDPSAADNASNLKTVALSDQTQIITTNAAPNEKSLADFARAMGFDEAQVASLFGPHAAQTMISGSTNTFTLSAASSQASASNSMLASATGQPSMLSVLTQTDPALGTAANPLSKLPSTTINSTLGLQGLNTQAMPIDPSLQAAVTSLSTQSALAGSMSAATTSPGLAATGTLSSAENLAQLLSGEGVDPQSVQLTIGGNLKGVNMPGLSVGNANTNPTSTLAILNMTGSQLSEHAIAALQKEFNQLKGLDKTDSSLSAFGTNIPSDSSLLSSAPLGAADSGANAGGSGTGSGTSDSQSSNAQAASNSTPVNMAETYEKLSDQLTAELSKRMHEQISQGQWKMKFALKPSTLGAVDVQLEMKDGKLAAVFQADNALTQNLLQHSSQQLKDNLKDLGLQQTYVQVDQQNGGQSQQNDQQNNAKNPFELQNDAQSSALAQDSSPVVDASIRVKNPDSLLDLMA